MTKLENRISIVLAIEPHLLPTTDTTDEFIPPKWYNGLHVLLQNIKRLIIITRSIATYTYMHIHAHSGGVSYR